jgi:integrase/recombinase XerD
MTMERNEVAAAPLPVQISRYLVWMRSQNYSERTVEARAAYLNRFAAWCAERDLFAAGEVSEAVLERYKRHLYRARKADGKPLCFRTQRNQLVPLRGLFRWLYRCRELPANPAADLEMPRMEKRLPKAVLSREEAEAVLSQPDLKTPLGIRDRAILEVFYSTGLRRGELAALRLEALDASRGLLIVRQGKGKKDRVVPIGERALKWTQRYLEEARPKLTDDPDERTLFLGDRGRPWHVKYLSAMVAAHVRAAEIGKEGSCHLFRHTCATLMLENGADIRYIQQLLGHACLATTEVYTQVSIRQLKEVHTRTHPAKMPGASAAERKVAPADAERAGQSQDP